MSILVKICGLKTRAAVAGAVAGGADLVGFVFFARSPRHVAVSDAAALVRTLPETVRSVAVTVNADEDLLAQIAAEMKPDFIQFHGAETAEQLQAAKTKFGVRTLKALPVHTVQDVAAAHNFAGADLLLFDAKARGEDRPGGLGKTFDWQLLSQYHGDVPWLLSGGLAPGSVAGAIRATSGFRGFAGVDVSSGVETAPGKKDPELIKDFIAQARSV